MVPAGAPERNAVRTSKGFSKGTVDSIVRAEKGNGVPLMIT